MATVLKMLLAERHLNSHPDFLAAYDMCAAQLDPPIPRGHGPAKAQYYQWLSGRMVGLPRYYHRRVLEKMFPGWTVEGLFQMADSASAATRLPSGADIQLQAFLGAEAATRGTTLVYPTLELTGPSVEALREAGIPRQRRFGSTAGVLTPHRRIDFPTMLPENDIRGLLYVFSLLQRYTGIPTYVQSDREMVAHFDRPYISFGLTGNDCTRRYLDSVEYPLFSIRDSHAGTGLYPERLDLSDGSSYESSRDRNIGIIVRVRPSPDLYPGRYCIYCAGLGPRGTPGASWYLANNWSLLQRRAGDREFVAVIGVRGYSDQTAGLEHLLMESTD
ncbi:hypothetical protein [Nocardia fusca]|uniref:hypothetical protein n=1 Tax=Nocardia fusca TaxID=941183 RepID=UPI0012F52022|nr:hypothetical protein [Nocardia fusca]